MTAGDSRFADFSVGDFFDRLFEAGDPVEKLPVGPLHFLVSGVRWGPSL